MSTDLHTREIDPDPNKVYMVTVRGRGPSSHTRAMLGPFTNHALAVVMADAGLGRELHDLAHQHSNGATDFMLWGTVGLPSNTPTTGAFNAAYGLPIGEPKQETIAMDAKYAEELAHAKEIADALMAGTWRPWHCLGDEMPTEFAAALEAAWDVDKVSRDDDYWTKVMRDAQAIHNATPPNRIRVPGNRANTELANQLYGHLWQAAVEARAEMY